MKDTLQAYRDTQLEAHVDIDDVLNKVTQEVWELLEAQTQNNREEMHKEARDVVANVLSVLDELGGDFSNGDFNPVSVSSNTQMSILLGEWNTKVQSYRQRYSREKVNFSEVVSITKELVNMVLSYSNGHESVSEMMSHTTKKFQSRAYKYIPDICLNQYIDTYLNFPKEWISFKDIAPILRNPEVLRYICMKMAHACKDADVIVWLDARGFLFWPKIADILGKPFVMARKPGKLPWETAQVDYSLEYGKNQLEIQKNVITPWQNVAVIDDLLATGGTVGAAIQLIESLGGNVVACAFVIALQEPWLRNHAARKNLWKYNISSVLSYEE